MTLPHPIKNESNKSCSLPGINHDRTEVTMPVTFGATREYADNEGWQLVGRKGRKGKKGKKSE